MVNKIFALWKLTSFCSTANYTPSVVTSHHSCGFNEGRDNFCTVGDALAQEPGLKKKPRATRVLRCSSHGMPRGRFPTENFHLRSFPQRIWNPLNFAQLLAAPNTQKTICYPDYPTPVLGVRVSFTCLWISALSQLNRLEICVSTTWHGKCQTGALTDIWYRLIHCTEEQNYSLRKLLSITSGRKKTPVLIERNVSQPGWPSCRWQNIHELHVLKSRHIMEMLLVLLHLFHKGNRKEIDNWDSLTNTGLDIQQHESIFRKECQTGLK